MKKDVDLNNHKKRIRNLVIVLALTAMILSISTYAWFIGLRTVNVSDFDVEIAATKDLQLSLNGKDWADTVTINSDNYDNTDTTVYNGHTNYWAGRGLIPMSSVGDIDSDVSRLILYEKASVTKTPGGYRLMSSRVPNEGETEVEGYVAFDLFIKNYSGRDYIEDFNILDEEEIYLSTDSEVTVASSGVEGTGIENSVRVAFAQIGRVVATTTSQEDITGITCETAGLVTGICSRTAQIWEPNDKDHVEGAINYYNTSCKPRLEDGEDVTLPASYGDGACEEVEQGVGYPTYAIKEEIGSDDNVDVYDGEAYNGYEGTTKLEAFPYFTDSMKMLTGTDRPGFINLAANSITKVRIYIYLEGQDIDNYDFASIGKAISVKFGFTKQRMVEDDFNYDGPEVPEQTNTTTTEQP